MYLGGLSLKAPRTSGNKRNAVQSSTIKINGIITLGEFSLVYELFLIIQVVVFQPKYIEFVIGCSKYLGPSAEIESNQSFVGARYKRRYQLGLCFEDHEPLHKERPMNEDAS
jgi:hypothetical protein